MVGAGVLSVASTPVLCGRVSRVSEEILQLPLAREPRTQRSREEQGDRRRNSHVAVVVASLHVNEQVASGGNLRLEVAQLLQQVLRHRQAVRDLQPTCLEVACQVVKQKSLARVDEAGLRRGTILDQTSSGRASALLYAVPCCATIR